MVDDDGSADHSIVTSEQRVHRPRVHGEGAGAHAVDRDPPEERRDRGDGETDEAPPRGQGGGDRDRKKRRRAPPRAGAAVPGARDELVVAPEHTLLPRAPTVAVDEGPAAEPGDPALTDPEVARRALRTPRAYAEHCMILAEAFRRATGATRAEGLAYLARMLVAIADPVFGRAAMKELGPSTGIVDLYPLELLEHVIDHHPGFLPKVARGRFVRREPPEVETFVLDTDAPLVLRYRDELKVRGFAVVGGARPGYRFEPVEEGAYALSLETPGRYTCAVSCLSKTGQVVIDRLEVRVHAGVRARPVLPVDADLPPRDADKVAAWPIPAVPEARRDDVLSASEARRRELESRFSADELAQRIGVLGLANLRARLAARRERDEPAHEETHPSWAAPGRIVIEREEVVEERAPRDAGVPSAPLPVAQPRKGARPATRTPEVDVDAARSLLARQDAVHDAQRAGPMVMAPRGLGTPARGTAPVADDDALSDDFEGEEPTSDLEPDATEALDRAGLAAMAGLGLRDPEPTRPIDLDPPTARGRPTPVPSVRLIDPEPTRPIDLPLHRPRAAVVVRTVEEVDRTRPLDREAVLRLTASPPPWSPGGASARAPGGAASSEPDTRPIVIDPARALISPAARAPTRAMGEGPGFADVRPHDRTQPIPSRRPPASDDGDELEDGDEPGDHTLAELE